MLRIIFFLAYLLKSSQGHELIFFRVAEAILGVYAVTIFAMKDKGEGSVKDPHKHYVKDGIHNKWINTHKELSRTRDGTSEPKSQCPLFKGDNCLAFFRYVLKISPSLEKRSKEFYCFDKYKHCARYKTAKEFGPDSVSKYLAPWNKDYAS